MLFNFLSKKHPFQFWQILFFHLNLFLLTNLNKIFFKSLNKYLLLSNKKLF